MDIWRPGSYRSGMAAKLEIGSVDELVQGFADRTPIRTGSLITTIYGDMVAPRGGTLWLGSLLSVLAAFGVNDSQARTAMSRLAEDDWVSANRIGRKSYYTLTPSGSERFDRATRRIYSGPPLEWTGEFCVVIAPGGASPSRDLLRKELGWIGFGCLSTGAFIHPDPDEQALQSVLSRVGPTEHPIVVKGASDLADSAAAVDDLVKACWDLDQLSEDYGQFMERFGSLHQDLERATELNPWHCVLARIMLIHEYRRVILRDPLLPSQLLPSDWAGAQARNLARDIYSRVAAPSEAWISENFEREEGVLPSPNGAFWDRFGGLRR